MDLSGLLVREGAVARASGRVLVANGETWFERPGPEIAIYPRPTPVPGRFAIRPHGVDLDRLDRPSVYNGVLEGWATLTGTWRGHELHVQHQGPWVQPTIRTGQWHTPPCPPPPQGWSRVDEYGNLPQRPPQPDQWPALTITNVTQFRIDATHGVYVVAAEDPDLLRHHDAWVCVVASRYTRQQLEQIRRRLGEEMQSHVWSITMQGVTSAADGQPLLDVNVAWVVPEMIEWAATLPDGILDLDVWLLPAV